jgi:hypothetical protein
MPDSKLTFEASRLPSADQVVDRLPSVFRLQSIARFPFDERHTLCQAALFHEQASLKVEWLCRQPDNRLCHASLWQRSRHSSAATSGWTLERPPPGARAIAFIRHSA